MSGNRRLSNDARTAFAKLFGIQGFGEGWALVLGSFPEAKLRECERLIGLDKPDPEFRKGIADAIFFSVCLHVAPPKRASTIRRELELVEKRAAAAATDLQQLSEALDQSVFRDLLPESLASLMAPSALDRLNGLAAVARQAASGLKDIGGRPRMAAFDLFIRLLADAFGGATGHRATLTGSGGDYGGRFWELIDRVLPTAEIAGRLAPEGDSALGSKVQEILRAMDKTSSAMQ